jgi:hypothetical protein
MIELGWARGRAFGASCVRPAHDLNELYCRTRSAQAEAERHGFAGMAAALADMAANLAREPGVDPAMVRALAGHDPAGPGGAPALDGASGGRPPLGG